jgi:ribosomal protein L16 Arg81 hydroxylase
MGMAIMDTPSLDSLEAFLAPIPTALFLSEYYCRAPLHIGGEAARFSHLLSWDDLNTAANLLRLRRPLLRLAMNGKILPEQAYSTEAHNSGAAFWRPDWRAVRRLLKEGATLLLDRIEETHAPIRDLCGMLEVELGANTFADAFASWQQTQGLPVHWDVEEVFVLQLAGTKHWRVTKPDRLHPTQKDKTHRTTRCPEEVFWQGDLSPGDLLYIPGGWWHEAVAVSNRTLHVAVSQLPATGLTAMNGVLRALEDDELARTPLPRFANESEQQNYILRLRGLVDEKLRGQTVKSILANLDARATGRTRLSMPWSSGPEVETIPADAWIHWLPPRPLAVKETGAEITFEAIGAQFLLVANYRPLISDLSKRRKLSFRELCSGHPQLPVETMVHKLISLGLVAIAKDAVI